MVDAWVRGDELVQVGPQALDRWINKWSRATAISVRHRRWPV
jgi:hypothetical protein